MKDNRALILALNQHNHDLRTDDDYLCPAHRAVRAPGSRRRAA